MNQMKVLVVVLFVVTTVTAWQETFKVTTSAKHEYTFAEYNLPVFKDGLNMHINAPACTYAICVRWLSRPPLHHTDFDNNCDAHWDMDKPGTVDFRTFATRAAGPTHIALVSHESDSCESTVTLSGEECASGLYGPTCQTLTSTELPSAGVAIPPNGYVYYRYATKEWRTNILHFNGSSTSPFMFYVRETNLANIDKEEWDRIAASNDEHKASIEVINPRHVYPQYADQYAYYITIHNPDQHNQIMVTFDATESGCPWLVRGATCDTKTLFLDSAMVYRVAHAEKGWFVANPDLRPQLNQFSIGLTVLGSQEEAPAIYIRFGNIPTSEQYDIKVHNNNAISSTRFYDTGPSTIHEGPWFVAAHVSRSSQEGPFGVWLNSDCPNNCNGNGGCSDVNTCECNKDYDGDWFECSTKDKTPGPSPDSGMSGGEVALIVIVSIESVLLVGLIVLFGAYVWWARKTGYTPLDAYN